MSIYATIGEQEPAFFASLQGWKELTGWADGIDADKYAEVVHVAEHGFVNNIAALSEQLRNAVVDDPPSEDVTATINELLDVLEGESGELIISSGIEAEEE